MTPPHRIERRIELGRDDTGYEPNGEHALDLAGCGVDGMRQRLDLLKQVLAQGGNGSTRRREFDPARGAMAQRRAEMPFETAQGEADRGLLKVEPPRRRPDPVSARYLTENLEQI